MLILSRKAGEAVVIDGECRITVLANDGRTVRLGIEAPSDVRILRAEIVTQVEEETRRALLGLAALEAAGSRE
ncbi:MAG TPA: carbon storage regulator CsrA [Gemmatimonadaceae bacterium]|nr:carbon storage regulator CsrA [Gemmatimonadaceae bacterium]